MARDDLFIGEVSTREFGELILRALRSEGIRARLVPVTGSPETVKIATKPENAELAREILSFLKTEITKSSSR